MKASIIFRSPFLAVLLTATIAHATDYYFGPNGSTSAACTESAPCQLNYNMSNKSPGGGDTVYLLGGTYTNQYIRPSKGGSSSAWLTFKAVDGQLPVLVGNGSSGCGIEPSAAISYVRFVGIAVKNWGTSGLSNGWNNPASKIEFINCIADGNGVNGIAFYKATGVLIQQSIVAHNGNQQPSWSSGVNLYTAGGTYTDNIVRQNVSFENIDISSNHTDGSGFILDQSSTGATFENNIGFRNGGSCIRLTNSSGSHIINNTCFGDGLDTSAKYRQEILYSDSTSQSGAVLRNNVLVASSGQVALKGTPATDQNNVKVDNNGSAPFFVSSSGELDFSLVSSASTLIDQAGTTEAPTTDIGFDPKCVKQGSPGGASWWSYVIDYTYIESIGGIAKCFNPRTRTSTPDIGSYEYNGGTPTTGGAPASTGGAPTSGGTSNANASTSVGGTSTSVAGSGGVSSNGGAMSATGGRSAGGASAAGGSIVTGGSAAVASGGNSNTRTGGSNAAGGVASGGSKATGGALSTGGVAVGTTGGMQGKDETGGATAATGGLANTTSSASATGGLTAAAAGGVAASTGTSPHNDSVTSTDQGGCGCRIADNRTNSASLGALGLLALAAAGVRRRRAR